MKGDGNVDGAFADFVNENSGEGVADARVCACYYCCWHGGGGDGNFGISPCGTSVRFGLNDLVISGTVYCSSFGHVARIVHVIHVVNGL